MSFRRLVFWLVPLLAASSPVAAELAPHVPGQILVKWRPAAKVAEVEQSLALTRIADVGHTGAVLYAVVGEVETAVASCAQHQAVEYVEPNYLWSVDVVPNDPSFDEQWALDNTGQTGGTPGADVSAVAAWATSTGAKHVVVAVIDSGIDLDHPDLFENRYVNPGEIEGNGLDDDGNGFVDDISGWDFLHDDNDAFDDNEHGTHVAGTIGAVGDNDQGIVGVTWNVSLMPVKFLDVQGRGNTVDAVQCVEYATLMSVDVINASWGGGNFSMALRSAIERAGEAGIVFVAAAGNDGTDTDIHPHFPASYDLPNIVSVASTDDRDRLSAFSNFGLATVDLAAPGEDILSTRPGRTYGVRSGTSMATPHVTGTFALLRSILPQVPVDVAIARVLGSVDPQPDLAGLVGTGGRLNTHRAIANPDTLPPDPVVDLAVSRTGSNWLELAWTATGDDRDEGSASRYELRYATFEVNEISWPLATVVPGLGRPADAGEAESFRVGGLDFSTWYSLALMVFDDFGNPSLSNGVTATTLGAPSVAMQPDTITDAVSTGAVVDHVVQIANLGEGTLDFELAGIEYGVVAPRATIPSVPTVIYRRAYESGALDGRERILGPRAWPSSKIVRTRDAAGPDILFFEDFESGSEGWTHVATAGDGVDRWHATSLRRHGGLLGWNVSPHPFAGSDALQSPPIDLLGARAATLSFFHWYDFDDCGDPTFEADGGVVEISLDDGLTWQPLEPIGGYPYLLDTACGNPLALGGAYAHRDAPGDEFLPAMFDLTAVTGHVVRLRFHAAWDCGNCQDHQGWYVDDVTVTRALAPWARVTPQAGTVWTQDPLDLTVQLDARGLLGGSYGADLLFASNDPVTPQLRFSLTLEVTGAPDLFLATSWLDFDTVFLGTTASRAVSVYNLGEVPLMVTSLATDDAAFTVGAAPFSLEAFGMRALDVECEPTQPGLVAATLTLVSDDPHQPTAMVSLQAVAAAPPKMTQTPSRFDVELAAGTSTNRTLTLHNEGSSELTVRLSLQPAPSIARPVEPTVPDRSTVGGGSPSTGSATQPVEVHLREHLASPAILVVQNTLAWGLDLGSLLLEQLGVACDVVAAEQLGGIHLDEYDLVVTASDEDDAYYQTLSEQVAALEDFVRKGGVLQAQSATHGADLLLPGGVVARWGAPEVLNRVVLRDHPVTAGLPTTLEGDGANHNVLTDLPPVATILTETFNSRQPTTAEYTLGRGLVLATGMTWELLFERSFAAGPILRQALAYSFGRMRVGGLPWVFTPLGEMRLGAQESLDVELEFDGSSEGPQFRRALLLLTSNDPARPQARIPLALTVTGLTPSDEPARARDSRPMSLALEPLGPNPTGGEMMMRFALPTTGPTRLGVYDMRGRLVKILLESSLPAGRHTARWSGTDRGGRAVAAGVYFLRLDHAHRTQTARVVVWR